MTAAPTVRRPGALVTLLLAFLLAIACSAPAALAAPAWRLTSVHGPQNMPPGDGDETTPEGQYVIQAYNVGDQDLNTTPDLTVIDTLPAGVSASAAFGKFWSCSATTFPTAPGGTVSCSYFLPVPVPGASTLERGAAEPLKINVSVADGASGTESNLAEAKSEAGAVVASTTDPTSFDGAQVGFGFVPGSFAADLFDARFPHGSQVRQAGSHPYEMRVDFKANLKLSEDPDDEFLGDLFYTEPAGAPKTIETKLPLGLIGDPQAVPRCPTLKLLIGGPGNRGRCPAASQVGSIDLILSEGKNLYQEDGAPGINVSLDTPVFSIEPPPGTIAALAFSYVGNPVYLLAELDPSNHYSVITKVENTNEIYPLRATEFTLWGVPADPSHDPLRFDPDAPDFFSVVGASSNAPIKPFLTLPPQCDTGGRVQQRMDSWQNPGEFTPLESGEEIKATGCEDPRIRFGRRSSSSRPPTKLRRRPASTSISASPRRTMTVSPTPPTSTREAGKTRRSRPPRRRTSSPGCRWEWRSTPRSPDGLLGCSRARSASGATPTSPVPTPPRSAPSKSNHPAPLQPAEGLRLPGRADANPHDSLLAFYR